MTLKEYVEMLYELVQQNEGYGDLEVVYASDDEGNDFNTVHCTPTLGFYNDREFRTDKYEYDEWGDEDPGIDSEFKINAVCIN